MPRCMPTIHDAATVDTMELHTMPKSAYRLSDDEKENNNGVHHANGLDSPSNGFKYSDCEDSGLGGKESGGRSGRRKQSKPARVFLDMEGGAEGDSTAAPAAAAPAAAEMKAKSEVDMDVDISCDLCNDTFSTQSALTDHIQRVHALNATDSASEAELFPTKYHRLGSELQQEVVFPTPVETKVDPSQNDLHSRPNSNSGESHTSSSKARIFHQDAFCKMCDREFCNKYFLKIHMANKHGVFEEGSSPMSNGGEYTPTKPSSIDSSPPTLTPPAPPPPKAPPLVSIPVTTPSKSNSVKGTGKTKSDMEDYCEICQKHFCNKYYLRKHKNDVHGIAPDVGSVSAKKGRPSNGSNSSNGSSPSNCSTSALVCSLPAPITTSAPNPLLLPPMSTVASSITSMSMSCASSMPSLNSMANVMFINPFAPPVILQAQPVLQAGTPAFPPPPPPPHHLASLPTLSQPPINSCADSPKGLSTSASSPSRPEVSAGEAMRNLSKSSSRPNDSLRSMGILNADAYCDICRKEFCNKYFLGIHKANKHGIYVDDAMSPLMLPGLTSGMPENLSLRSVPEIGEKEKLDMSKIKTEGIPTSDEVCEICKKEFNNKFSLKIHLVNAHNIKPQDFDLGLELFKSDKMNGGQGNNAGATMFGNMIAAKLADRVTCEICNKEVCNKYFLRTHKIKVHGMDPTEAEKEPEMKTTPTKPGTTATGQASSPAEAAKEALQRPNDEELLKMGIDPEAYCEICRKEFCSKYFLKTHKANIHGIKADCISSMPNMPAMPTMTMPTMSSMSSMPSMSMASMPNMPTMPSLPMPTLKFPDQSLLRPQLPFGIPQSGASMVPLPGALPMLERRASPDSDGAKSESKWMWKEPINQTRVMCEICNKELCNKYFLKTHMMKKHGITYDISTGQMLPKEKENAPTSSPAPLAPLAPPAPPAPLTTPPVQEKESPKADTAPEGMIDSSNNVVSAKTWSIPPQQLQQQQQQLQQQQQQPLQQPLPPQPLPEIKVEPMEVSDRQTCSICSISFGEKVTLQFHMIRDHGGEVTVPSSGKEDSDGNRAAAPPESEHIRLSLKRKYKKRRSKSNAKKPAGIGEEVKSAIMDHLKSSSKKKFRCVHCHQRFLSKDSCRVHIRSSHPQRSKQQAFSIQGGELFLPSDYKLKLPVLQAINQPITVTLTPADL